ncbi:MAG TPA: hypothetical protein VL691_18155, partial [Vicinamibacteria bacterium]|nr:hypothetical protein [Vicinamibacteria bacterium]
MSDTRRKARASRQGEVAPHKVELPEGITAADWGLERVRVQNPSIRSYLGCIRLLEEVLDSNYAILHCSPERLLKIWRQVEQVCQLMRSELLPTLKEPSIIPSLDDARRHAADSFRALAETVLTAMERYDHSLRADQLPEVRKLLCVSIGKIHAFLRDTFGEIVANDPRSRHDADYFLSRRFAQDIEESEWLYSSVYELNELLDGLVKACSAEFSELLPRMRRERMVPPEPDWEQTRKLLDILLGDLAPKLKEVLSLRGIRIDDMESLESHASSLSTDCRSLLEVYAVGRETIEQLKGVGGPTLSEREQRVKDLISCHRVVSGRLVKLLMRLHTSLRDLAKHIDASKSGIEKR